MAGGSSVDQKTEHLVSFDRNLKTRLAQTRFTLLKA
jgi:hypothetical protein